MIRQLTDGSAAMVFPVIPEEPGGQFPHIPLAQDYSAVRVVIHRQIQINSIHWIPGICLFVWEGIFPQRHIPFQIRLQENIPSFLVIGRKPERQLLTALRLHGRNRISLRKLQGERILCHLPALPVKYVQEK